MLHALCVIALAMLFSGGTVRLCRIFVKFSGFVVIVVCHVGSISSAPSAQQHAGLRPVPTSHGMVWCGFAESSIKPHRYRDRGVPSPQTVIHRVAERREMGEEFTQQLGLWC